MNFGTVNGNCHKMMAGDLLEPIYYDDDSGPGLNAYIEVTAQYTGVYSVLVADLLSSEMNIMVLLELVDEGLAPALSSRLSQMAVKGAGSLIRKQLERGRDSRAMASSGDDSQIHASSKNAPGMAGNLYTWAEFGGFHSSDDSAGRSYRGTGGQFGFDLEVSPGVTAGLSFGAQSLNSKQGGVITEGDLLFVRPYLGYENGTLSAEASFIYGRGEFDQDAGAGEAKTTLQALAVSVSQDFALQSGHVLTGTVAVTAGQEKVKGTAGVLAGLNDKNSFAEYSLGGRYSMAFKGGSVFAGLYADYLDMDGERLIADELQDEGLTGRIELGASIVQSDGFSLDGAVNLGGLGSGLTSVSGAIRVGYRF